MSKRKSRKGKSTTNLVHTSKPSPRRKNSTFNITPDRRELKFDTANLAIKLHALMQTEEEGLTYIICVRRGVTWYIWREEYMTWNIGLDLGTPTYTVRGKDYASKLVNYMLRYDS